MARKKKNSNEPQRNNYDNYSKTLFGSRYVFFSSLGNTNSVFNTELDAYRYGGNPKVYAGALRHFSGNTSNIDGQQIYEQSNFNNFITNMVKQLREVAANERQNEIKYLSKTHEQIKKQLVDKNLDNNTKKTLEELNNLFSEINENWDYVNIIRIFNRIRGNSDIMMENLKNMYTQLINQEKNEYKNIDFKKMLEERLDDKTLGRKIDLTLEELYSQAYGAYKKEIIEEFKPLQNMLPEKVKDVVKDALSNAVTNTKQFIDPVNKMIKNGTSSIALADAIKTKLIELVKKNPKLTSNKLQKELYQLIEQGVPALFNSNEQFSQMFTRTTMTASLQELALIEGEGLADYFISIVGSDTQLLANELNKLDKNLSPETFQKIQNLVNMVNEKGTRGYKSMLTKVLKQLVINQLENVRGGKTAIKKATRKNRSKQEKRQELRKFLEQKSSQQQIDLITNNMLMNNLTVTQISGSDIAEVYSGDLLDKIIKANQKNIIFGRELQLKNDAVFSIRFTEPNLSEIPVIDFKDTIENFMKNFMSEYSTVIKQNGLKGEINVDQAVAIWNRMRNELKEKYELAINSLKNDETKLNELNKYLEDLVLGGISVKEYNFYNSKFGFHGGSLGGNNNAIKAIETVNKMYAAGGISTLDTEVLIEAVLNCSNSTVLMEQNPDAIKQIQDYLIGGALMAMFDEGFSNSKPFFNQLLDNFNGNGPAIVHLYQFNTLYVPQSYMINNICDKLIEIDQLIESEIATFNTESSVLIINKIDNQDIIDNESSAARWNDISAKAQAHASIYIRLAAGLLDIFEHLPEFIVPGK